VIRRLFQLPASLQHAAASEWHVASMACSMDGTALTRHVQGARIDPESLEQENDQGIEALSERTKLLRQVGAAFWHL